MFAISTNVSLGPSGPPLPVTMDTRSAGSSTAGAWSISHNGSPVAHGNGDSQGSTDLDLARNPYGRWSFTMEAALLLYTVPGDESDSQFLVVDPVFTIDPNWFIANPAYSNLEIKVQKVLNRPTGEHVTMDPAANDLLFAYRVDQYRPASGGAAVPMPSALAIGAIGMGLLVIGRRLRRR